VFRKLNWGSCKHDPKPTRGWAAVFPRASFWARPAVGRSGSSRDRDAAPQAGVAVLASGDDPARELGEFGVLVVVAPRLKSEG